MKQISLLLIAFLSLAACQEERDTPSAFTPYKHVVIVGFDGLSPDGLKKASTPNFNAIMAEGAYSMHARAVLPTSSSTNWASMIMGAGPEQHGITSNNWERDNYTLPSVVEDDQHLFPTEFNVINRQIQPAEIGAIYHWSGFGRLFEKNAVDYDKNPGTEDGTAKVAAAYIKEKKPTFTFIHFDHVDHAGHEFGHGTPAYYQAVSKADKLLGEIFQAVQDAGIADETLIIISSDHGGIGKGHGGESLAEIEIPFILWGKNVKKNYEIKTPVYQYDNAATVIFALGLQAPEIWIGRPVKSAFEGFTDQNMFAMEERLHPPVIIPEPKFSKTAGGLYTDSAVVEITNPNKAGDLHLTLNGKMPDATSPRYDKPFIVKKNTVVKSAVFQNGKMVSLTSEAFFRIRPNQKQPPVQYELYYLSEVLKVPDLTHQKRTATGRIFEITTDELSHDIKDNTAVRFTTTLKIDSADTYTFYTRSDDGSKLWINHQEVVNNDGDHGIKTADGSITLKPGEYPLEVVWFNAGGGGWLDVYYQSPSQPRQILPTTIFN